jgi:hypothetical protein
MSPWTDGISIVAGLGHALHQMDVGRAGEGREVDIEVQAATAVDTGDVGVRRVVRLSGILRRWRSTPREPGRMGALIVLSARSPATTRPVDAGPARRRDR